MAHVLMARGSSGAPAMALGIDPETGEGFGVDLRDVLSNPDLWGPESGVVWVTDEDRRAALRRNRSLARKVWRENPRAVGLYEVRR